MTVPIQMADSVMAVRPYPQGVVRQHHLERFVPIHVDLWQYMEVALQDLLVVVVTWDNMDLFADQPVFQLLPVDGLNGDVTNVEDTIAILSTLIDVLNEHVIHVLSVFEWAVAVLNNI